MSTDDDENEEAATEGKGGEDPETEGDTASGGAPEPPDEPNPDEP